MILESIRAVADALNSTSYGVNVQFDTMAFDGTDSAPPDIAVVADETRDNSVAVGRYPTTFPALVVTVDGDTVLDGEVVSDNRDGDISIIIRYLTKNADTAEGNSETLYTLRAVQKCLRDFNSNTNVGDRVRNNIQIIECLKIEHLQLFENISDANITGGIRATFKVRDAQP